MNKEGTPKLREDLPGGIIGGVIGIEYENKLVTPDPNDRILIGNTGPKTPGYSDQQLIAKRMPEGVVDSFEPIKVGHQ